tara:strand:+ start:99 stop:698 length:600 start_codon:yes stop_codon:yes gene_type:complete
MAHPQQQAYLNYHSHYAPVNKFFGFDDSAKTSTSVDKVLKVLEVGSYNVNGSCRSSFNPGKQYDYIGCDVAAGPCVDIVSPGHLLDYEDEYFDFVISCECFEHDMHYEKTLPNIIRMLRSKGAFLFSCATTGRPEHGTPRTSPQDSPATQRVNAQWSSYYKNLTEEDIRIVLDVDSIFSEYEFSVDTDAKDLYFYGVKR